MVGGFLVVLNYYSIDFIERGVIEEQVQWKCRVVEMDECRHSRVTALYF